jgi:ABC-type glycerol-3-phosphate transport system substrate-binding protein
MVKGSFGLAGAVALAGMPMRQRFASAQGEPKKIEYWHRLSGDSATAIDAVAQQFNAEHAGLIEVTAIPQGDIQQLSQKVRAAAAGGGLPGALMADDANVLAYYKSDVIVPFDDYVGDATNGLTQEERDDFLPNQLTRHQLPLYDNHQMTMPIGFSTFTLYWNIDALAAAGITAAPKTWVELADAVRAVAAATPGMVFYAQADLGSVFIFMLNTYGVSWLKESGEESNFDAPEALEAMTLLKALGDEKLIVPEENHTDLFAAGKSPFFLQSSVNARRFPDTVKGLFQWDAGMPPQGRTDRDPQTEMFGPLNVLPKTDDETQLAGWTWLKWLTSPAPHAQFNQTAGYFPARKSAALEPVLADYYASNPIHAALFENVAPFAKIPQPGPGLVEIRGAITSNVVASVLLGRLSAEEAVKQLKGEADEAIQNAL